MDGLMETSGWMEAERSRQGKDEAGRGQNLQGLVGCGEDAGLHSKYEGKPLVFLSKGGKGSNLCFQKIPVAFMWQ